MELIQLQNAIERIAKMDHAGVSPEQIAAANNITLAKLTELQEADKYKEALAVVASESFDKVDVLNGGWDIMENLAMNKVVEHLQKAPDADFALKAAAFANKAVRRGKHINAPIGHQPNEQAIINVNIDFAKSLDDSFVIDQRPTAALKKKDDNFLPPKKVAQMLGDSLFMKTQNELKSIDAELGDIGSLVPAF